MYGVRAEKAWRRDGAVRAPGRITAVVRAVPRLLLLLLVAAAAAAAALAHVAIDIVADYAVAHASYDDVASHGSRELVVAIAVALAASIAWRALQRCCDVAARARFRAAKPPSWWIALPFAAATAALACAAVPAMEWTDTLLAGRPLGDLSDAFGGSVPLGIGLTVACALLVASAAFALVRWLLSHRDRILAAVVAVIGELQGTHGGASSQSFALPYVVRRRNVSSLRRGKRAPPRRVVSSTTLARTTVGGYPCSTRFSACAALS